MPEPPSDIETATSRLITCVAFHGLAVATVEDFIERAGSHAADEATNAISRWIASSMSALQSVDTFQDSQTSALAEVLDDLTPTQARMLAAFLPDGDQGRLQDGAVLQGTGDVHADLHDLFVLACRVTAQAVVLISNSEHVPPWLVWEGLDPFSPSRLPDLV
jgi:hypothetical protein